MTRSSDLVMVPSPRGDYPVNPEHVFHLAISCLRDAGYRTLAQELTSVSQAALQSVEGGVQVAAKQESCPESAPRTETAIVAALRDALEAFDKRMQDIGGCGDGYCLVTGKATGMHTNGGCRCWSDKYTAQRVMGAARNLRDALSRPATSVSPLADAVLKARGGPPPPRMGGSYEFPLTKSEGGHGDGNCGCTERCKDRENCQYDVRPQPKREARPSIPSDGFNCIYLYEDGREVGCLNGPQDDPAVIARANHWTGSLTKAPSADHDAGNLRSLAEPTPRDSSESTTGGVS